MTTVSIRKQDTKLQIVWAEVYVPYVIDSQGDFMTPEEIRRMAYDFVTSGAILNRADVNHSKQEVDAYPVESFIVRDGDPDFPIPGSWVIGQHVPNPALWSQIEKGEINGFSMDGIATNRSPATVEIDSPEYVRGQTDEVGGHAHAFVVKFDADGTFLGGMTEPSEDGHRHVISRGTVTDDEAGHTHRFSFVELIHG